MNFILSENIKIKAIVFNVIFLSLIFAPISGMCVQVLNYGFEDFQNYDGSNSPAPGYIYTHPDASIWSNHIGATRVTAGGTSCGGNTAYEGLYYQHIQFNSTRTDPCLGGTGAANSNSNFGYNGVYPRGTSDTTHFGSVMTGPTAVLRFMFRVTNDWTSAQTDIDGGGGLKFIRWGIGNDYHSDDNNILVKLLNDRSDTYPKFGIYDRGTNRTNYYTPSVNWQDGNWHSFGLLVQRTGTGAYDVTLYVDDWDMAGTPLATRSTTVPNPGNGYYHFAAFGGNWSAKYPPNLMGMDLDKIEVWNSMPDGGTLLPPHANDPVSSY